MFDNWIAMLAGKYAAGKLKLQEGSMPMTPWYKSKTIWSDVVTILLAVLCFVDKNWTGGHIVTSPYYGLGLTFLGALGIYGRATATTIIGTPAK